MRLVVAAVALAAVVAPLPTAASNINTTFANLQASFAKEVSAVVGDVLWSLSFDSVKLTFTSAPLEAHGVCDSPSDDLTSFLTDMTKWVWGAPGVGRAMCEVLGCLGCVITAVVVSRCRSRSAPPPPTASSWTTP
jgi:hypothetical protein